MGTEMLAVRYGTILNGRYKNESFRPEEAHAKADGLR